MLRDVIDAHGSKAMWQVYAAFRLGDYQTGEVDLTPALGISLIVTVVLLMLQNS